MRPPGAGRARAVAGRLFKDILSDNLDSSVALKDVARECGLSMRHFSRAFRRTVRVASDNWPLRRRIEVDKETLRHTRLSRGVWHWMNCSKRAERDRDMNENRVRLGSRPRR
jgi:AraC-like DNA-binding protein